MTDINTWLDNPNLRTTHMGDRDPEHALDLLESVAEEPWQLAVIEPGRTLLVRQVDPELPTMLSGVVFDNLKITEPIPTAHALSKIGAGSDISGIGQFLAAHPYGCVVTALDTEHTFGYPLS